MATLSYINPQADAEVERLLPAAVAERPEEGEASPLRAVLATLLRRKWWIVAFMAIAAVLSILYVYQLTPRYVAEGVVVVETRRENVVNIRSVLEGPNADFYTNETEAQVLRSRTLAAKVVDQLDLVNNPYFNRALSEPKKGLMAGLDLRESLIALLPDFVRESADAPARQKMASMSADERQALLREQVIDYFLVSLTVIPTERSRAIRLAFVSESPDLAALAINTLADIYILDSINAKYESTARASDWLNERVNDLRKRTQESQQGLEAYRRRIGVIDMGQRASLLTQQIAELNTKLIAARSERSEAEARFSQYQRLLRAPDGIDSAAAVLNSPLIQRMREQEALVGREIAELRTSLREEHPRMRLKMNERADLEEKLRREISKIGTNQQSELEIARVREQNLLEEVNRLQGQISEQAEAEVTLRQLESEYNANKQLFETVLNRFKELDVQEQGLQQADARLISPAVAPLRPAYPKKTLIVGFAVIAAAVLAVAVIFLLEHLDVGFRAPRQVEAATGVPVVGAVPLLSGLRSAKPQDQVIDKPQSVFAEAIRGIRTALLLSNVDKPPQTVLFTSSVPSEGKTSTALSLARASARAGQRVLIIDCDVRSPALHTALGVPNLKGTVDILSGETKLEDAIEIDERSGAHFITAGQSAPNPTDLLGSARMRQVMERLRQVYDLIIIDTPPVLAVSDVLVMLRLADKTCFLVRWGKTPRELVVSALRQVSEAGADLLGTVMTQVDTRRQAAYNYGSPYQYGAYRKYYGNR